MSLHDLLDRALFSPDQWREIVRGDQAGLDILSYADPKFDAGQMGEIIRGLSKGLDVSIYATPVYNEDQMFRIRRGLEKRLNILDYNSPANSAEEMKWRYDGQRRESGEPPWGGYLPLGRDTAQWLYQRGAKVTLLYVDASHNCPAKFETLSTHPGLFAVPENDLKSMTLFRAYQGLRRKEVELLTSDSDQFGIYQVKEGAAYRDFLFERLERLNAKSLTVSRENYQLAYVGHLVEGDTLNSIYERFNLNHPKDYTGRSLSVSDVVLLRRDGKTEARYVDSYDFPEIQGFFGPPMLARNNGREAVYELDGGKHLTIELQSDRAFHCYTIVGPDFLDIQSVLVPATAQTMEEARQDAASHLSLTGPMREVNHETFLQRAGLAVQEPTVKILWTESGGLHDGQVLQLHDADQKFRELDAAKYAESQGKYYDKTKFEITYMMDGELRTYEGRQDLGDGDGGLIERMEGLYRHYRSSDTWQAKLAEHGDQGHNEAYDYILDSVVPYLKKHVELAGVSQEAFGVMLGAGSSGREEGPFVAYGAALSEYATACRRELNTAQVPQLPPPPQERDFRTDPEAAAELEQSRRALWHEARAHGKTPQEYLDGGGAAPQKAPAKSPRHHGRRRPKGPDR